MHDAPKPQSLILIALPLARRHNCHEPKNEFPQHIGLEKFRTVDRHPLKKLDSVLAALQKKKYLTSYGLKIWISLPPKP
jgi:hypothetical protein